MADDVSYGRARQWTVLIALWLATLVVGLDTMVLSVALTTLSRDLGATNSDLQWVTDAYTLALAALLLPAGLLADRIGRRRVLLAGLVVFGASSAAGAVVDSPAQLIAARAVMGLGAAVLMSVPLSVVPTVFGAEGRGRAMSILVSGMMLGLPLGPILGGYLLEHYWWGSVFLINVPVVLVALAVVAVTITDTRAPDARRPDLAGVTLSTLGLVALVYGIIEGPNRGWTDPVVLGALAGAVLLLLAFGLWQTHAANPLIRLSRFRDRRLSTGLFTMTIASFALFGVVFVVPQYLQVVLGYTALGGGLRLLPMIAGLLASAPASDRLARRYGRKLPVAGGMLIIAVGLLVHSRITADSGYALTAVGLAVEGFGIGLVLPPAMDAALGAFSGPEAGIGSATIQSIRQVGAALSVAVLGSVLNVVYRNQIDPHLTGLPAGAAHAARGSVGGATIVADRLGPAGRALRAAADAAFSHGISALLLVCAGAA
ncbi:MAG: MFS transporter, partial [Actinocatenispora sp.]